MGQQKDVKVSHPCSGISGELLNHHLMKPLIPCFVRNRTLHLTSCCPEMVKMVLPMSFVARFFINHLKTTPKVQNLEESNIRVFFSV
jgi:hypothetical protein